MCANNPSVRRLPAQTTYYVGRVGALAVALGVGTAVIGLAGAAAADAGSEGTSASAGGDAVRSEGSGPATDKASADKHRSTTPIRSAAETASGRGVGEPRSGDAVKTAQSNNVGTTAGTPPASHASVVVDAGLPSLSVSVSVPQVATGSVFSGVPGSAQTAVAPQAVTPEIAVQTAPAKALAARVGTVSAAVGDPLSWLGGGAGDGAPAAAPLVWAAAAVTRRERLSGAVSEAAPVEAVTTGQPVDPAAAALVGVDGVVARAAAADLEVGACLALCLALKAARLPVILVIADQLQKALPAMPNEVATTLSTAAFDVINGLMLKEPDAQVAGYITGAANNPGVLAFVSQTVAGLPALAAVPADVSATIGNAVGSLVQNTLGNTAVALALVPVLQAVNLPTDIAVATPFIAALKADPAKAILTSGSGATLRELNPNQMQAAFISAFGNSGVQAAVGNAVAGAIDVLLGASSPSWAAPVNPNAIADYAGQALAAAVLGADNPNTAALATTISSALTNLLSAIGGTVATQAGNAVVTLLNQPGVGTALATAAVNGIVTALGGTAPFAIHDSLAQQLAPAAGTTVTSFINGLFSTPAVPAALGVFLNQLVPGMLGNPGVQDLVGQLAGMAVTAAIGGDLGQAVGAQIGNAIAGLLANPAVSVPLTTLINTVIGQIIGAQGVVSALATAAGQLTTAEMDGTMTTALPAVLKALQDNTDIRSAVGPAVTNGVAAFLGNAGLWTAVDATIASLVPELIGDAPVQNALSARVAAAVAGLIGGNLGQIVGAQVGAAVVSLITNPAISGALVELVDTVLGDFFGPTAVVSALSGAAGQLATAAVAGDLKTVLPQVTAALKANAAIQAAVGVAVGDAVRQFLGDKAMWTAVDAAAVSLVTGLISDPAVQQALDTQVSQLVSVLLGGDLGQVVGPQVGAAVVALVTSPAVGNAVTGLVDTVFGDFFGATGVVDALANVADQVALAVIGGADPAVALKTALATLRANTNVDAAVGLAVGDAVRQFLGDKALWSTVDTTLSSLVTELLGDTAVQQALGKNVAAAVSALVGGGAAGQAIGAQVAGMVVGLVTDPALSAALIAMSGSVVGDFFGASGVVNAFADVSDQLALALVSGDDPATALKNAAAALKASPAIQAALRSTVNDALSLLDTNVLSNPAIQQELGTAVTTLVAGLADNPAVQAFIVAKIGPPYGDVVGNLLANTTVVDGLASALGLGVTQMLAYPGFNTALTGAIAQFAVAVLNGTAVNTAMQDALQALQSSTAFIGAVNDVMVPGLNTLLASPEVRQAVSVAAKQAVIAALGEFRFHIGFLDAVAGQVVGGTVDSFLGRPAGADLLDSLTRNLLLGMPLSDVGQFVTQAIIHEPSLQIGLGMSIGAGIGSLFGDNVFGEIVGMAAGLPITVAIGVAAAVVGIFEWLFGAPEVYSTPMPAADDPYVITLWLDQWLAPAAASAA